LNRLLPEIVISCEHADSRVPPRFQGLFHGSNRVLSSHRGFDAGAGDVARTLASSFGRRPVLHPWTRLLVDANRSPSHPSFFSEYSKDLPERDRQFLFESLYTPYRIEVEGMLRAILKERGRVIHLSVHTFTPVLHGIIRRADIGLLYDPSRIHEKRFCKIWKSRLQKLENAWCVRLNYPYRGVSDGLVPIMRRTLGTAGYVGLELEVNQKWFFKDKWNWKFLKSDLVETCRMAVENF
jgi:predicted N-formylglutamate amidohydrolase